MNSNLPTSIKRLARANPAPVKAGRVDQPAAQALLQQILGTPRATPPRAWRMRSPRVVAIALTAGLAAAGGAFAATDPFGFWRSTTPGSAMYRIDTSNHADPITTPLIGCQPTSGPTLQCGAHVHGQRYELQDTVKVPPTFTRAKLLVGIKHAVRQGKLSQQQGHQFTADLAAVSDDFLARLNLAMHFRSNETGPTVPPASVPTWIACQRTQTGIACQDLNGDEHVPVGGAIYMAVPSANWRPLASSGPQPGSSSIVHMMNGVFGRPLTSAEYRLLRDFLTTTWSTSSSRSATVSRSTSTHTPQAPTAP